jgi:hypothetical protein
MAEFSDCETQWMLTAYNNADRACRLNVISHPGDVKRFVAASRGLRSEKSRSASVTSNSSASCGDPASGLASSESSDSSPAAQDKTYAVRGPSSAVQSCSSMQARLN